MHTHEIANPNKKRKLSAVDAGDSPASKHYCGISGVVALPQERVEGTSYSDSSGAESAHGSNSFGDACFFHQSAAAEEGEVSADNGKGKAVQFSDYESTSASSWSRTGKFGCGGDTSCSSYNEITGNNPGGGSGCGDGDEKLVSGSGNPEFHEEHIDEFGYCLDYILSATEEEGKEGNVDHQEHLYHDGIIPRSYLMSSENCYNDEDFLQRLNTRGPTIDQEFEQYFSSLML